MNRYYTFLQGFDAHILQNKQMNLSKFYIFTCSLNTFKLTNFTELLTEIKFIFQQKGVTIF
jgi:hypothetical protein